MQFSIKRLMIFIGMLAIALGAWTGGWQYGEHNGKDPWLGGILGILCTITTIVLACGAWVFAGTLEKIFRGDGD